MLPRATLLLLTPLFAAAQTAATNLPEFEAASVKPVPLGTPYGGMMGGPGTGSPAGRHLEGLWRAALPVIGPRWFDDERFDIVAKVLPGTTMPQFQLMLQRLLADWFHLDMHKVVIGLRNDGRQVRSQDEACSAARDPAHMFG
jgi:hypothetical protein